MDCLTVAVTILALANICFSDPAAFSENVARSPLVVLSEQQLPKPYEFGYEFGDGLGMTQHRREVADGTGAVSGSYGYLDPLGVNRIVECTADGDGYKALVRSNEPGTAAQNAANAVYIAQSPPVAAVAQGLRPVIPILAVKPL